MSQQQPKIITIKEIKNTNKHIGFTLVVFALMSTLFVYGMPFVLTTFKIDFFSLDTIFITILIYGVVLIALVSLFAIISKKEKIPFFSLSKKADISLVEIIQLSVLAIAFQLLATTFISMFFTFFNIKQGSVEFLGNFSSSLQIARNLIYFVSVVILETIVGEFIFRGVVLRSLSKYGIYFAYIGSALLYACSQSNIISALPAFVLGLFYGKIAFKYNSIRPTIYISTIASVAFYLVAVLSKTGLPVLGIFVFIIYIVAGLILFIHREKTIIINKSGNEKKLLLMLFSSPFIIVYILLFLTQIILSYL